MGVADRSWPLLRRLMDVHTVVYRATGLYLRGKTDEVLSVDKALLDNRVERRFTERFSTFGQFGYLRDRLKEIDYLLSPGGGVSYAFVKNDRVELSADVDPDILGGIVLRVGNQILDASIRNRLEALRRQVAKGAA